jgi:zinc protease
MKTSLFLIVGLALGCATLPGGRDFNTNPPPDAGDPSAAMPPAAPPPPPDPGRVTDGDTTVEWFQGAQVIVKRIPGADFVSGELFIRGGVRNWNASNAGVEDLALAVAAHGGTQTLDKDAFNGKLSGLGSTLDTQAGEDFSTWTAKALAPAWDETFGLMVDAFLRPAMPASEIELERTRQVSGLQHEAEDPDGQLRLAVRQAIFHGHPYANRAVGTVDTVKALTAAQLTQHLARLRETSRMLWVVVGDVSADHVMDQVRSALAGVPRGSYAETPLPEVHFDQSKLTVADRPLPTNYIESVFMGPRDGSSDTPAGMLMGAVLGWRMFEEVRTKRNLSYAAHAGFEIGTALPRGFLYVTATQPNETMKVMFDEVRRIQSQPVPPAELEGNKSVFVTGYYMANEATEGQARLLGSAQIYWGDWHVARKLPDLIGGVSASDLQAFAGKYMSHLQTVVVGQPKNLDQALLKSL